MQQTEVQAVARIRLERDHSTCPVFVDVEELEPSYPHISRDLRFARQEQTEAQAVARTRLVWDHTSQGGWVAEDPWLRR